MGYVAKTTKLNVTPRLDLLRSFQLFKSAALLLDLLEQVSLSSWRSLKSEHVSSVATETNMYVESSSKWIVFLAKPTLIPTIKSEAVTSKTVAYLLAMNFIVCLTFFLAF